MSKTCTICREKGRLRCDKCGNDFCHEHAIKCSHCGTITCIRDLSRKIKCRICNEDLEICPECLLNGLIIKTIPGYKQCPDCGWSG